MNNCLNLSGLRQFHAGELNETDASRVRVHLDECKSCKQLDADLLAEHDEFVQQLRGISFSGKPVEGQAMAQPGSMATLTEVPVAPPESTIAIEGYEVLHELHRGGQGVVYKAYQKSMKRKVAIKVLLHGKYSSVSARRRFEREIELVASLKHPNIIAVYDSGITSDNRPYCVMDYIEGQPLDKYIRRSQLPLEDTLQLFGKICDAVTYAHQRGVIHRDLKPANILVDAAGSPRVLDFGLAKHLAGPADRVVSVTGQIVGTLPYMSPEQAEGSSGEVDTRSDVYSLGVILYELLTGRYPYPVVGQMADVLKHIVETPAATPSSQWSPDTGVSGSKSKRFRSGKCPIDDEIQTIVLQCLAKERERRYESAGGLLRDIERYLADQPIEAKRDSTWYVLRKLMRRHAWGTIALGCVLVTMLSFGSISFVLYRQSQATLRQKEISDALMQQTARQRDLAVGSVQQPIVHRMAFLWALNAWRTDQIDQATGIRDKMPACPERRLVDYLLNAEDSFHKLLKQIPRNSASLAYFVAGERYEKNGMLTEAIEAFQKSASMGGDDWIKSAASARFSQLTSKRDERETKP
jgi:serine/threonine protein kinase